MMVYCDDNWIGKREIFGWVGIFRGEGTILQ